VASYASLCLYCFHIRAKSSSSSSIVLVVFVEDETWRPSLFVNNLLWNSNLDTAYNKKWIHTGSNVHTVPLPNWGLGRRGWSKWYDSMHHNSCKFHHLPSTCQVNQ
jgi:hypothetical protein